MGNKQRGLLGCVGCFLVLACVYCPSVGGGCGCVLGLGIKRLMADKHTVGFTFNTVLASAARVVVVARAASR